MKRKPYPTDLTDEQWAIIEPLIPPCKPGGRDRKTDMRELVNALRYLVRGGVACGCCLTTFPRRGRCGGITGAGAKTALGCAFMMPCGNGCGPKPAKNRPPAPGFWTAKASRPRKKGAQRL